jgi:hypothetical protein
VKQFVEKGRSGKWASIPIIRNRMRYDFGNQFPNQVCGRMRTADWWMIEFHFTINLKAKIKNQASIRRRASIHEGFATIQYT